MKKTAFVTLALLFPAFVFAQGVKIGSTPGTPDPSSVLDVESTTQGLLPPRMTTSERDAISLPADGLVLFNTTTNCLNFRVAGFWKEVCGTCTPAPSPSNAGIDQLNISGTTASLSGNLSVGETGVWTIQSGVGGSLDDPGSPTAVLTGEPGNTYVLRWTLSNVCGSTYDEVNVSFVANYKWVFLTSATVGGGNLGGLSGADNICQSRASAAGLPGTYKAWLSDGGTSAASRLTQYSGEYRMKNGTKVADSWADLTDGSIDNTIDVDEYGNTVGGSGFYPVYTNSTTSGAVNYPNAHCNSFSSSSDSVWAGGGNAKRSDGDWTSAVFADCQGTWANPWRLYCFEQ